MHACYGKLFPQTITVFLTVVHVHVYTAGKMSNTYTSSHFSTAGVVSPLGG